MKTCYKVGIGNRLDSRHGEQTKSYYFYKQTHRSIRSNLRLLSSRSNDAAKIVTDKPNVTNQLIYL